MYPQPIQQPLPYYQSPYAPVTYELPPPPSRGGTSHHSDDDKDKIARRRETNRLASKKHREKKRHEAERLREVLTNVSQTHQDTVQGFEIEIASLRETMKGLMKDFETLLQASGQAISLDKLPSYQHVLNVGLPPSFVPPQMSEIMAQAEEH